MFTGIIEALGTIERIEKEGTNVHFTLQSPLSDALKIDQSVAHNGVCLTVIAKTPTSHTVTAIDETLQKTNLNDWKVGDKVNLERAMLVNARLDGHIVQGHVDMVGTCQAIEDINGSWQFTFQYPNSVEYVLVNKGSVCINGVSLTVVDPTLDGIFSVCIIPYTFENTVFGTLKIGDKVNLEFDIIGKYVARLQQVYR